MKLQCLGRDFRVLIAYRLDKEVFLSYLAEDHGGDLTVVARYEYHATHPGWHFHGNCDSTPIVRGRTWLPHRAPSNRAYHRKTDFGVTGDDSAQSKAISAFGLDKQQSATGDLFS